MSSKGNTLLLLYYIIILVCGLLVDDDDLRSFDDHLHTYYFVTYIYIYICRRDDFTMFLGDTSSGVWYLRSTTCHLWRGRIG